MRTLAGLALAVCALNASGCATSALDVETRGGVVKGPVKVAAVAAAAPACVAGLPVTMLIGPALPKAGPLWIYAAPALPTAVAGAVAVGVPVALWEVGRQVLRTLLQEPRRRRPRRTS